ncbi:Gfo/Idh/MocA family oxidoreductase [Streptosporangium sp. NPDC049248]|uniref:Gfo/Idh/MocA family protein n=1 Tax=Streptosporangium sp. NPDC049248 TaxID=3155651 RepID=UPI00343B86CA
MAGGRPPARRLRLGLACTGWIADWAVHQPIRDGSPADVVFVASRDPGRAREYARRWSVPASGGWWELLERRDVDAVYVATPNADHARLALDAVLAGKHVLCEKPLGRDPHAVAELAAEAHRRHVLVREAYHYRAHPAPAGVLAVLRAGVLGTIRRIDVRYGWWLDRTDDVRLSPSLDGGALMDVGCYGLDLVGQLTRGLPEITGTRTLTGPTGVDLTCEVRLRSGPVRARVWAGLRAARPVCEARVTGTKGGLRLRSPFLPVMPGAVARPLFGASWSSPVEVTAPRAAPFTSYKYQLDAFARDVAAGAWGAEEGIVGRAHLLGRVRERMTGER